MACSHSHLRHRRGAVFVYAIIIMTALCALVSLAVDYGHVQLAKGELERAADAAARYGVKSVSSGLAAAQSAAMDAADDNTVDGSALVLSASNIQIGNWSGSTFTSGGTPANAIKVIASRSIPLMFSRLIGVSSSTVHATAIVKATGGSPTGFVGLNGMTLKNNLYVASYNSATTTSPTQTNKTTNAALVTNGTITGGNNNDLWGSLILGPSAKYSGVTVHPTSNVTTLTNIVATPADPTWSPATNPNGLSQNYTVSSNTTLPGGTYYFTSLTINANLSFSGPATIYVNGNIVVGADLWAYNSIPSNLVIYQLGAGRTFGDSGSNHMDVIAQVIAPQSDFTAKNNLEWRGSALFNTMTFKNNGDLYYDEAIGPASGTVSVSQVK